MATIEKSGTFVIAPGRKVSGQLRLSGRETSLLLQDSSAFDAYSLPDHVIGTLFDFTEVTLIQCIPTEIKSWNHKGQQYHSAKLFPHFVLEGRRHISPSDRAIAQISFVIDDAAALFYDFDAFGVVIEPRPYIEQIATANGVDRKVPIGSEPQIVYFAGKRKIVEASTCIGNIHAQHNPGWCLPDPRGVRIDNVISIQIEPDVPVHFHHAISRILRLLRFLELIAGRPQNLCEIGLRVDNGDQLEQLNMHWSYCPKRDEDSTDQARSPHPGDVLLDPVHRPEEFICVLREWLRTGEERHDARDRFHNSFSQQRKYFPERLVGSANMFDILPISAVPDDVKLSDDLLEAKKRSRELFLALPDSYERSAVLSTLGRLGKASLKHKTRYRAEYVLKAAGEQFPDLVMALDEAVNCRNHYVHGSASNIDYSQHSEVFTFLTQTLEFVFGASELIEAGWDIQKFIARGTSMSHPFGDYWANYKDRLQELKRVAGRSVAAV